VSGLEISIFTALWVVLLALAALVLILYRQMERAYRRAAAADASLPPGSEAPEIQVLRPDGSIEDLDLSDHHERIVLAFVRAGCEPCSRLLRELAHDGLPERTIALVNGEGFNEYAHAQNDTFEARWLAHPPDVVRAYGVTVAPLVYVVRRGVVLSAKSTSSRQGVEELLAAADRFEHEPALQADPNGKDPATGS
jgi:hypothetical protein